MEILSPNKDFTCSNNLFCLVCYDLFIFFSVKDEGAFEEVRRDGSALQVNDF